MKKRVKLESEDIDNSSSPGRSKATTSIPRHQQERSVKLVNSQQVSRSPSPPQVQTNSVSVLYSLPKPKPSVIHHRKLPGSHLRVTNPVYVALKNDIQEFMVRVTFQEAKPVTMADRAQRIETAETLLQQLEQLHRIGRNEETRWFLSFLLSYSNRPKAKFHVCYKRWDFTRLDRKLTRKLNIDFGFPSPPQFGPKDILPPLLTQEEKIIKTTRTELKQTLKIKKKLTLREIIIFTL